MEQPAIRRRGAEDHISGLPDELLHTILVRVQSAAAAARTSILSRRWRGVWAHMPELVIGGSPTPARSTSALLDSVSAALDSYAAPTLGSLEINVTGVDRYRYRCAAGRIAPWLRFASERLTGKLCLRLCVDILDDRYFDEERLALPVCERATEIKLYLWRDFVLRLPPTGSFSALADLSITCTQIDGGELGRLVSSPQCPRLRKLCICRARLAPVCDVSISSESLECLHYRVISSVYSTGKLEVNAPMLREISVSRAAKACIVAPKLENVEWSSTFDPSIHQLSVAGRHVQSLHITHSTLVGMQEKVLCVRLISSTRLMEIYDTAKELKVSLDIKEKTAGYLTFLKEMDKLPICESLVISMMTANHHALPAVMLHLLRRCICIKKFKLFLPPPSQINPPKVKPCSILRCPCLLPENCRLDDITFNSLEEIGIKSFTGSDEQEEFMKLLLSKCNTVTLKRVDIIVAFDALSSKIMKVVKRIRSVGHPNSKVQFNVLPFAS